VSFKGGGRRTYTDKPCVLCLLAGMLLFSSAFVVLGFVAAQVPHGAPRPDPPLHTHQSPPALPPRASQEALAWVPRAQDAAAAPLEPVAAHAGVLAAALRPVVGSPAGAGSVARALSEQLLPGLSGGVALAAAVAAYIELGEVSLNPPPPPPPVQSGHVSSLLPY
jgi:hypothetical protein